jgi:hypothetical protein
MKGVLLFLILLIGAGWFFVWVGEYAIHQSHAAGQYQHKLTAVEADVVTDGMIMEGMQLALRDFGLDRRDWGVSAHSSWQPTNATGIKRGSLTNLVVLMVNHFNGNRLFVRVHYTSQSNLLEYVGTRSK